MNARRLSRLALATLAASALFLGGVLYAEHHVEKPSSVIHVVTLDWADGASKEDIQKALDGVETLAAEYDGITRIWLKSIKSQTKQAAFVMEFKDLAALEAYSGSDAQKNWYKVYLPVRGGSVTSDITN
jgi:hypothetical protein